jgi:eukaryotic-like serine/threonine-protein kinase
MAPEQARGAVVDKRADIWAFGVVLYEMLTGNQPFAGETVSDTLAAVLRAEPQWDAIPVGMRRLVRRCLEKNPKLRLRDIGDAMPLLDEVAELKPTSPGERRARWLWPCVSALAVLAAASLAVVDWQRKPPQREMIAFNIEAPAGQHIQVARVSPDGKQMSLVVGSSSRGGTGRLLIRSMDSPALRPVPGTEDISADPYWSPDSRKIAFQQGGQIKTVDLTTGSIQILCRAERIQLSDWGANGVVLFSAATGGNSQVFQVPAAGGSPRVIMPLDDTRKESSQTAAQFLPDGKRFMYYSQGQMNEGTYVVSLDGKFRRLLKSGPGIGLYLKHPRTGKSYLLLFDPTTWLAQQFDTSTLQLIGDPVIVRQVPAFSHGLTATPQGLVYSTSPGSMARNKLAWYSRAGKELDVVSEGNAVYSHELSPDNGQVAWELLTEPFAFGDIWVKDLVRGAKIRLTSDSGWEFTQRFWPDGSKIAFMWYRAQPRRLHIAIKPANGTGSEELVLESPSLLFLNDVSPDGAFLLYAQDGPPTTLWVLPMKGDRRPILFRRGQADSMDGRFSPDGRWIAYTSSESGGNEIQVQAFVPEAGVNQRTRGALTVVSTDGGRFPRWSRDAKELFYLAPDNSLMVVPVKTTDKFTVGRPEKLFRLPGLPSRYRIPYAVAADSRRFLIAVPESAVTEDPTVVLTNWMESLP